MLKCMYNLNIFLKNSVDNVKVIEKTKARNVLADINSGTFPLALNAILQFLYVVTWSPTAPLITKFVICYCDLKLSLLARCVTSPTLCLGRYCKYPVELPHLKIEKNRSLLELTYGCYY